MILRRQILHYLPYFFMLLSLMNVDAQTADNHYQNSLDFTEKGAFQQALVAINKAMEVDSSKGDYYLQRASINYQLEEYEKTISDCYTALRLNPKDPRVYFLRGQLCVVTESYGGAILFYGKCLQQTPEKQLEFEALLNRGKTFLKLKRFSDAHTDLRQAYLIDSTSFDVLINLAEAYLRLNRTSMALKTLNEAIAVKPDYSGSYWLLGEIAQAEKDFPKAIEAYSKFAELEPLNPTGYNTIATIYLNNQQFTEAFEHIEKAMSINPLESNSYKTKGLIYIASGEKEQGCNTLFRAMQLGYFEKHGYDLLDIYLEECEK